MTKVTEENARSIIAEHLQIGPDMVKANAHLMDDLGADSLDTIELTMAFEETFDIEITDEEMETAGTFEQVMTVLNNAEARGVAA